MKIKALSFALLASISLSTPFTSSVFADEFNVIQLPVPASPSLKQKRPLSAEATAKKVAAAEKADADKLAKTKKRAEQVASSRAGDKNAKAKVITAGKQAQRDTGSNVGLLKERVNVNGDADYKSRMDDAEVDYAVWKNLFNDAKSKSDAAKNTADATKNLLDQQLTDAQGLLQKLNDAQTKLETSEGYFLTQKLTDAQRAEMKALYTDRARINAAIARVTKNIATIQTRIKGLEAQRESAQTNFDRIFDELNNAVAGTTYQSTARDALAQEIAAKKTEKLNIQASTKDSREKFATLEASVKSAEEQLKQLKTTLATATKTAANKALSDAQKAKAEATVVDIKGKQDKVAATKKAAESEMSACKSAIDLAKAQVAQVDVQIKELEERMKLEQAGTKNNPHAEMKKYERLLAKLDGSLKEDGQIKTALAQAIEDKKKLEDQLVAAEEKLRAFKVGTATGTPVATSDVTSPTVEKDLAEDTPGTPATVADDEFPEIENVGPPTEEASLNSSIIVDDLAIDDATKEIVDDAKNQMVSNPLSDQERRTLNALAGYEGLSDAEVKMSDMDRLEAARIKLAQLNKNPNFSKKVDAALKNRVGGEIQRITEKEQNDFLNLAHPVGPKNTEIVSQLRKRNVSSPLTGSERRAWRP